MTSITTSTLCGARVALGAIAIESATARPARSGDGTLGCENPGARKTKPAQRAKASRPVTIPYGSRE